MRARPTTKGRPCGTVVPAAPHLPTVFASPVPVIGPGVHSSVTK